MRILPSILGLVCVAGAGCTDGGSCWYNPSKTLAEAKRDRLECRHQAVTEASDAVAQYYYDVRPTHGASGDSELGIARGEVDRNALRGWTEWGQTYRENIFRGCMRCKGFQRVRADELDPSARRQALPADHIAGRSAYPHF